MDLNSQNIKKEKRRKYVISKAIDSFFFDVYTVYKFILRFFKEAFMPPYEFQEIIRQCFEVGYKSLPLIAAGKVGSNIGAELGSMKVTEQIDAMEVSATNPFKFLVVTRVMATTFMMPVLVLYTAFVGMIGAYLNVHHNELTSFTAFFEDAFESISFLDIFSSLFKSLVFGFTIGIAGCYQGYNAANGTQGVGKAANTAVVISMFLIFIEEMVIVQITNAIRPA